ncbi:uncharacterized protein CLAFUR5_07856 [Fulvia fulva]|uniref:DUF6604 domain-containing protein n=1 Tax=Passalora fulva TaxID=5499 RepID=A0A9Q8LDK3_PASFU|nr:uncharacterized protein CLAFUR5_07856 [Fulvia fulva]KAK4630364.1 hypothetical protein CLAFUR0_07731 [Fulvia fulva]UJO15415.1 hypothetical protein CLAFUR5_07856 [Fulvia fulva]
MSSEPLVNTYKRYKAGTEKLIDWLLESAARCETRSASQKRPRDKEKAKVPTRELCNLAQRIVESKKPIIEIRLDILHIAEDVLVARAQFADFYTYLEEHARHSADSANHAALTKSNAGHQHFVKTLRQVYELLRGEHKARQPKHNKKTQELATDAGELINLYRHLDLEEPSEDDFPNNTHAGEAALAPVSEAPLELGKDVEEHDDTAFRAYCLLKDLHSVISYIRSVWQQYATGELSIWIAAKLTESAQELVQSLCDEYKELHPQQGTYEAILDLLNVHSLVDNEDNGIHEADQSDAERDVANITSSTTSSISGDMLLVRPFKALTGFVEAAKALDDSEDMTMAGVDDSRTGSTTSFAEALTGLPRLLKETFPFIKAFGDAQRNDACTLAVQAVDGYTYKLLNILAGEPIDLATVVGTQICMGVFDAMDGETSRGFLAAKEAITRGQDSAKAFAQFPDTLSYYAKQYINPDVANAVGRPANAVVFEVHEGEVMGWTDRPDPKSSYTVSISKAILCALPLLPVLRAYRILFATSTLSSTLCGSTGIAISVAHLHKAGLMAGYIKRPWKDLEMYIKRQNQLGTFLRQGDRSVRSVLNQFGLAIGLTLKQLNQLMPPSAPRLAVIQKNLRASRPCRYGDSEHSTRIDNSYLGNPASRMRVLYDTVKRYAATPGGIQDPEIAKQWNATRALEPAQLLKVALEVLVEDKPHMMFDGSALFEQCVQWLGLQAEHWAQTLIIDDSTPRLDPYNGTLLTLWYAATKGEALFATPANMNFLLRGCYFINEVVAKNGDGCMQRSLELSSVLARERFTLLNPWSTSSEQSPAYNAPLMEQEAASPTMPINENKIIQMTDCIDKARQDFTTMTKHGLDPQKVLRLVQARLDNHCREHKFDLVIIASIKNGALEIQHEKSG